MAQNSLGSTSSDWCAEAGTSWRCDGAIETSTSKAIFAECDHRRRNVDSLQQSQSAQRMASAQSTRSSNTFARLSPKQDHVDCLLGAKRRNSLVRFCWFSIVNFAFLGSFPNEPSTAMFTVPHSDELQDDWEIVRKTLFFCTTTPDLALRMTPRICWPSLTGKSCLIRLISWHGTVWFPPFSIAQKLAQRQKIQLGRGSSRICSRIFRLKRPRFLSKRHQ